MQIIYKKLEELKPYENNPRINDQAVSAVMNSIENFGFKNPIIIDSNNVIVCGHTRYKAAQKLNLKEVPTIIADDLSPEQINAFRLADNKVAELAEWDEEKLWQELNQIENIDMSSMGFDPEFYFEEETPTFEDLDEEVEIDTTQPTTCKAGDVWILGNHRLMCGSSTDKKDVKKLFNKEVADLLFTDPPYNVDYGEKANALNGALDNGNETDYIENDNLPEEQFIQFLVDAFTNAMLYLKEGGAFYIWHASSTAYSFLTAMRIAGMQDRQQIIWAKNSIVLGRQDYQWKHEPCFYGWKEGAGHYFIDDRTFPTVYDKDSDLESLSREDLIKLVKKLQTQVQAGTVAYENKPVKNDLHPTMKPIALCARFIKNSTKKGELVYDAFAGSGSSLIACEQTGRRCLAMELSEHYCDVIIKRWEDLTGQKAIKEETKKRKAK